MVENIVQYGTNLKSIQPFPMDPDRDSDDYRTHHHRSDDQHDCDIPAGEEITDRIGLEKGGFHITHHHRVALGINADDLSLVYISCFY
jgi:hypothetical protein